MCLCHPMLSINIHPISLAPSMIGLSESDHYLALCQSGRYSSSMFELANVFVAPFETVTPIPRAHNQ